MEYKASEQVSVYKTNMIVERTEKPPEFRSQHFSSYWQLAEIKLDIGNDDRYVIIEVENQKPLQYANSLMVSKTMAFSKGACLRSGEWDGKFTYIK
jgi:hypothetical protein